MKHTKAVLDNEFIALPLIDPEELISAPAAIDEKVAERSKIKSYDSDVPSDISKIEWRSDINGAISSSGKSSSNARDSATSNENSTMMLPSTRLNELQKPSRSSST